MWWRLIGSALTALKVRQFLWSLNGTSLIQPKKQQWLYIYTSRHFNWLWSPTIRRRIAWNLASISGGSGFEQKHKKKHKKSHHRSLSHIVFAYLSSKDVVEPALFSKVVARRPQQASAGYRSAITGQLKVSTWQSDQSAWSVGGTVTRTSSASSLPSVNKLVLWPSKDPWSHQSCHVGPAANGRHAQQVRENILAVWMSNLLTPPPTCHLIIFWGAGCHQQQQEPRRAASVLDCIKETSMTRKCEQTFTATTASQLEHERFKTSSHFRALRRPDAEGQLCYRSVFSFFLFSCSSACFFLHVLKRLSASKFNSMHIFCSLVNLLDSCKRPESQLDGWMSIILNTGVFNPLGAQASTKTGSHVMT